MSQAIAARAVALFGAMAFVSGAVGAALERGWPPASDVQAVEQFIQSNRAAILAQSMAFSASATACIGFFAGLRVWLGGAANRQPVLSTVAFGSGLIWACLQLAGQALQTGVALAAPGPFQPSLLWSGWALLAFSNLPFAAAALATGLGGWRTAAFPRWLSALAFLVSFASLLLSLGAVIPTGPLAPNGWLTYALYPTAAVWLGSTTVVAWRGARAAAGRPENP